MKNTFIQQRLLSRILRINEDEIQYKIYNSYLNSDNKWLIDDSIFIDSEILISISYLPTEYELIIHEKINQSANKFPLINGTILKEYPLIVSLKLRLKFLYESLIKKGIQDIDEEILQLSRNDNEAILLNQKVQIFNLISILIESKEFTVNNCFEALSSIGIDYSKNEKSFYRKLKQFRDSNYSIESFISKARGVSKEYNQKVTRQHILKVWELRRTNQTTTEIEIKLKAYCEQANLATVSKATIKTILSDVKNKNRYKLITKGKNYFKNTIGGYIDRHKSKFKYQVFEADGSRLQIPYRKLNDSKWKVGFLTIYIVLDVGTNKVVGYWFGDFETTEVAITTFQNLMHITGYLPTHIRLDRSKANKSNKFKQFLAKASTSPYNLSFKYCIEAREKGTVESFFHWFPETICARNKHYIGLGIQTKEKRNSPEKTQAILNSKKLMSKQQLVNLIPQLIDQWNNRPNANIHLSPNELESRKEIGQAAYVKPEQIAYLTWEKFERTGLFRSEIQVTRNGQLIKYKIDDNDLVLTLSENRNITYDVYWNSNYPDEVYLYQGSNYMGQGKLKNSYLDDPINISDSDFGQMMKEVNNNNKFTDHVKESLSRDLDELRELESKAIPLNNSSGFDTNKKRLDAAQIDFMAKNYNMNPSDSSDEKLPRKKPEDIVSAGEFKNYPKHKKKKKIDFKNIIINEPRRL